MVWLAILSLGKCVHLNVEKNKKSDSVFYFMLKAAYSRKIWVNMHTGSGFGKIIGAKWASWQHIDDGFFFHSQPIPQDHTVVFFFIFSTYKSSHVIGEVSRLKSICRTFVHLSKGDSPFIHTFWMVNSNSFTFLLKVIVSTLPRVNGQDEWI